MTSREGSGAVPSNAGLNLLWPGLAQYAQGRLDAAAWFSGEAAVAAAAWVWWPSGRTLALIAIVAITIWSVADARHAER